MARLMILLLLALIVVLVLVVLYQRGNSRRNLEKSARRVTVREVKKLRESTVELSVLILDKGDSVPADVWQEYLGLSEKVNSISEDTPISELVKLSHSVKSVRSKLLAK